MKQMTPIKKQSKKAQRQFFAQQRGSWHGVNPVTKIVPNKKHYKRMKDKLETRLTFKEHGWEAGFLFMHCA